jgi:hypothetical protein
MILNNGRPLFSPVSNKKKTETNHAALTIHYKPSQGSEDSSDVYPKRLYLSAHWAAL